MGTAVVNCAVAPLRQDVKKATQVDELLMGMSAEVLSLGHEGFCRLKTPWGVEGFVAEACLITDEDRAKEWVAYGKMAARAPWLDVMDRPAIEGERIAELPRGGLLHPLGEQDENGWLPVGLPDGRRGFAKGGNLMPCLSGYHKEQEDALRESLAATALSYLGSQYRWGGSSPLGIDCKGLVVMAYLLNGITLSRRPAIEGGPLKPIDYSGLKMGDVLFFGEHLGMYLGDNRYVHSTSQAGSDGVVINSLDEQSPFYRNDLTKDNVFCGSLFV